MVSSMGGVRINMVDGVGWVGVDMGGVDRVGLGVVDSHSGVDLEIVVGVMNSCMVII